MQKAVPVGEGAMAALLNFDLERAQKVAAQAAEETKLVCAIANDNDPSARSSSPARKAAVERAGALALEAGAKRSVMLPVSAPFHCPLMQPAADAMAEALGKTNILMPVVPVIANVTAQPVSDPATIRQLLVEPGDRHRALARKRPDHEDAGRFACLRAGRRQGAAPAW